MGRKTGALKKKAKRVEDVGGKIERSKESLIRHNGELVSEFLTTEVYREIIKPLIDESIASVDGKERGGRWYFGEFNKQINLPKLQFYCGYSLALKEFLNRLVSFVDAMEDLKKKKEEMVEEKKQPIINPFLEELNDFNKEEEVWES